MASTSKLSDPRFSRLEKRRKHVEIDGYLVPLCVGGNFGASQVHIGMGDMLIQDLTRPRDTRSTSAGAFSIVCCWSAKQAKPVIMGCVIDRRQPIAQLIYDYFSSLRDLSSRLTPQDDGLMWRLRTAMLRLLRTIPYRLMQADGDLRLDDEFSLLARQRLPIKQVIHLHGFTSAQHFYKVFHRKFGMPPSDARFGSPCDPLWLGIRNLIDYFGRIEMLLAAALSAHLPYALPLYPYP